MLICDQCNLRVCHVFCDFPKRKKIPKEKWYCKFCQPRYKKKAQKIKKNKKIKEKKITNNPGFGFYI